MGPVDADGAGGFDVSDPSRGSALFTADAVVTSAGVLRPGWIEVGGDRITRVGSGTPPRPADEDLGAVTVVPGFVDGHAHGGGGAAFTDATELSVATAVDLHRRHGTTRIMASLVAAHPTDLLRQVSALAEHAQDGRIIGVHLEGPWMSPCRLGAHAPDAVRPPEAAEVERLLAAGRGTIRMVTLAPELPGAIEAIRRIVDAGAVAAIGHTDATYDQTVAAIDAGATVATHLFNAMRPVHHREPGPVVALTQDPRVTIEMIADGVHLHPAVYRQVCSQTGPDRGVVVTDAMAAAGTADGDYRLGDLPVRVDAGVARVAGTDTIAGSTATMDHLFRFAVEHGGQDGDEALLHAVRQTSRTPARLFGLPPGDITPDGPADLVVLDPGLVPARVMVSGAWSPTPDPGRPE